MFVKCTCTHPFQDRQYGHGVRVATPITKSAEKSGAKPRLYRCTVCRAEGPAIQK